MMLQLEEKIAFLEEILSVSSDKYSDSFNAEIGFYFNDFENIEENKDLFLFLEKFETTAEIQNWLDGLKSKIVMKFNEDEESLSDFIHYYIN